MAARYARDVRSLRSRCPLATLAAWLRTDKSPPHKGGFYIGAPHSPSALALRPRPPLSPLGASLRTRPPLSPSALALRARHANPTCPPHWHAPPHSPSALALRSRPSVPHSALALRSRHSAPHSALALRPRPPHSPVKPLATLAAWLRLAKRHSADADWLLHRRSCLRGLPRPRAPAAYGFRFGAPSPSSGLPPAE